MHDFRYDTGYDNILYILWLYLGGIQKVHHHEAVLITCPLHFCGQSIISNQLVAVIDTDRYIRISYVNDY